MQIKLNSTIPYHHYAKLAERSQLPVLLACQQSCYILDVITYGKILQSFDSKEHIFEALIDKLNSQVDKPSKRRDPFNLSYAVQTCGETLCNGRKELIPASLVEGTNLEAVDSERASELLVSRQSQVLPLMAEGIKPGVESIMEAVKAFTGLFIQICRTS